MTLPRRLPATLLRPLPAALPLAALLCLAPACKDEPAPASPGRAPAASAALASASGIADVAVTEKGFEPARIEAPPGQPITLRFTRKVEATCADAVQVQGDPVKHALPLGRAVEVKVAAPSSGEIAFACPMNMIKGAVVVAAPR